MRRLVGWPGGAPLRLAEDPHAALPEPGFADNLAMARAADPKLRSLNQEIQVLDRSAKLQKKNWAPVIEAQAQYFRLSRANHYDEFYSKFQADNWSVGFTLALPLWSGGRHADAEARARASALRAQPERGRPWIARPHGQASPSALKASPRRPCAWPDCWPRKEGSPPTRSSSRTSPPLTRRKRS
jgi:hypothetical protein